MRCDRSGSSRARIRLEGTGTVELIFRKRIASDSYSTIAEIDYSLWLAVRWNEHDLDVLPGPLLTPYYTPLHRCEKRT